MESIDDLLSAPTPIMDPPRPPGRAKGTPNKVTAAFKAALMRALELAGDSVALTARQANHPLAALGGAAAYLEWLATAEPRAFASLLGKLIPTQVVGDDDGGPVRFEKIVREIVEPAPR